MPEVRDVHREDQDGIHQFLYLSDMPTAEPTH